MRVAALALRAAAVVVVAGVAFSLLVDGAPQPARAKSPSQASAPAPPVSKLKAAAQKQQPKPPRGLVTISAVGDIVMGSTPNLPPDGGRSFFSKVAPDLGADVVLGNLEGTLSTGGSSKCTPSSSDCFAFQTPPSYARWLKAAGFTVLSLANNHAFDFGPKGQAQTLKALEGARVRHTGRPGEIATQKVGEIVVAVLGFAPYDWAQSLTDLQAARKLVKKAAATHDVVVVTMHGGAEGRDRQHVTRGTETYLGEDRGNLVAFSHAVVDAGADLVVGHGPHVMRGMEWYKKRLIAYSLGNFAGYKVFALGGPLSTSAILRVTLRGDGTFENGLVVATQLIGDGVPALDPAERAHGVVRALSRADFGPRAVKVSRTGAITR
jgi:poly-gamma-glutamate capsule biosynthesis protein CapA/YwtB (metallophosphatase superfamily)